VGVLTLVVCVGWLVSLFEGARGGLLQQAPPTVESLLSAALGILFVTVGIGLMRLRTWARWSSVVMISYPIGMSVYNLATTATREGSYALMGWPIWGYLLYLLVSPRGSVVFSPAYREVIARTPHIKPRTRLLFMFVVAPITVMILLMIGLMIFAIVFDIFNGLR
jgi:hypothetical protein